MCPYSEFLWSAFPTFELNTKIDRVSLRTQSKCGKIWTRKTSNTDTFHAVETVAKFYRTDQKKLRTRLILEIYGRDRLHKFWREN